jgi:hypothetical protein
LPFFKFQSIIFLKIKFYLSNLQNPKSNSNNNNNGINIYKFQASIIKMINIAAIIRNIFDRNCSSSPCGEPGVALIMKAC